MNTATAGVWQSETGKMRSRGKLVIIQMANCITGFCLSNWLTLGFSFLDGSVAWRFSLAFQCCKSQFFHQWVVFRRVGGTHPPRALFSYCLTSDSLIF